MNKKVSIVMTYYNRLNDLKVTLQTIAKTKYDNFEVVVVDDGSEDSQRCEGLVNCYGFNIKVLRINKEEKTWTNPCIPFNKGFRQATGNIVIIQNPECLHVGDVISHAANNITEKNYLTFSCYSINAGITDQLHKIGDGAGYIGRIKDLVVPYMKSHPAISDFLGWYNHPHFRPCAYHFCSAITKKNLDELGGFDERYAPGYGFDDNELLARIKRKGLAVKIVPPESEVYAIHQFHAIIAASRTWKSAGIQRNSKLFREVTLRETGWKANS